MVSFCNFIVANRWNYSDLETYNMLSIFDLVLPVAFSDELVEKIRLFLNTF